MAGATYVLGYLVWSVNAWANNLGMLPALETQYFVAGIIPMLILALAILAFRGERRFRRWYLKWLSPAEIRRLKWKRRLFKAIDGSIVVTIVIFVVLAILADWIPILKQIIVYLALFLCILILFLPAHKGIRRWTSLIFYAYQRLLVVMTIGLLSFLAVFLYAFVAYPNIPQEFGGLRPRCAYLDISQNQIAKETLVQIVPNDVLYSNKQVVQSNRVDVYFSGRDSILIKPHGQEAIKSTFEIKQDAIMAVTWCD